MKLYCVTFTTQMVNINIVLNRLATCCSVLCSQQTVLKKTQQTMLSIAPERRLILLLPKCLQNKTSTPSLLWNMTHAFYQINLSKCVKKKTNSLTFSWYNLCSHCEQFSSVSVGILSNGILLQNKCQGNEGKTQ